MKYLKPIIIKLIDADMDVEKMSVYLNNLCTRTDDGNNWSAKGIEAYLLQIGFPYYAAHHQPERENQCN